MWRLCPCTHFICLPSDWRLARRMKCYIKGVESCRKISFMLLSSPSRLWLSGHIKNLVTQNAFCFSCHPPSGSRSWTTANFFLWTCSGNRLLCLWMLLPYFQYNISRCLLLHHIKPAVKQQTVCASLVHYSSVLNVDIILCVCVRVLYGSHAPTFTSFPWGHHANYCVAS